MPLQLPAEVRVGDGNQRPGPLHGALVFQIRHAELRHHILDAGAGGCLLYTSMAYKRNPMRSERICSLSRYLMADAMNAPMTASVQWLERTLDDSANRRISMPEGFLCADAILRLSQNVTDGLHVNEKIVDRTCREYLPFIATENLMMEGVKRGGDRQALHEIIRTCSMAATARMKEGEPCDLLSRLAAEPAFGMTEAEMEAVLDPKLYIGRCPEQVDAFLAQVRPLLSGASREVPEISL